MFNSLDPVMHAPVRLAIMAILSSVKTAEFGFLLENIQTSKGNLSFQLSKLSEADYIQINKSFKGKYPLTTCNITEKGINAFENYVNSIDDYFTEFKNIKKNDYENH
jgi:DNA-binding transcriptional ArsR family regulator